MDKFHHKRRKKIRIHRKDREKQDFVVIGFVEADNYSLKQLYKKDGKTAVGPLLKVRNDRKDV